MKLATPTDLITFALNYWAWCVKKCLFYFKAWVKVPSEAEFTVLLHFLSFTKARIKGPSQIYIDTTLIKFKSDYNSAGVKLFGF